MSHRYSDVKTAIEHLPLSPNPVKSVMLVRQELQTEQPVTIRRDSPYRDITGSTLTLVEHPQAVSEGVKIGWAQQVVGYVQAHNERFAGAMYERSAEELASHIHKENAVVLLEGENVAYFGLSLPQFSPDQQEALSGFQLVEFANLIVSPEARNEGIGHRGTIEQFRHLHRRWNGQGVGYLTTENPALQHIYEKENPDGGQFMETVDWGEFPYIAGLTCSYSALGDANGHACEQKRRPPAYRRDEERASAIPCTLMISPRGVAEDFQETARKIHFERGGEPVVVEPGMQITTEDVLRVYSFYQGLQQTA